MLRVGGRALLDESSGARFEGLAVVGGVPSAFAAQYYEHAALLRESVQKFVGDDTQRSVEFDLDVRGQGYTAGLRVRGDAAAPDVSLRLRLRKGRFRCVGLSFVARGARPFEEDFMSTVGGRAAAPEALGTVVPVLWVETGEGRRAATADEAAAVDAAAAVAPALCATLAPDAGPVSESVVAYARGFEARRPESARGSGQQKRAKLPTSKAHISAVFHSFWLIFGRAIISRNGLEALMLFSGRARAEHSR